jgi:hypothetical protein
MKTIKAKIYRKWCIGKWKAKKEDGMIAIEIMVIPARHMSLGLGVIGSITPQICDNQDKMASEKKC